MSGYTEACDPSSSSRAFTLARDGKGQAGIKKKLMWTKSSLVVPTKAEAKSQAYWNTQIAAGNAVYVGEIEELVSNNTAATFYESPNGNTRRKDVAAKRIFQFKLIECACTHANLMSMDGANGRLFFETDLGYIIGKNSGDGAIGQLTSQFEIDIKSEAVSGTPVEYSIIDVTMASPKDDDANPFDAKIDWTFESLDEVNFADIALVTGSAVATATTYSFTMSVGNGCKELALAGVIDTMLKGTDANGNVLPVASVAANGANAEHYDVVLTTTSLLTSANIALDGIQTINSLLYASDEVTV